MLNNIISAEFLKQKRNRFSVTFVFVPTLIIIALTIIIFLAQSFFINSGANIWYSVYTYVFYIFSFLYPLLAILFILSFHEIELKASAYKYIFTIPINRKYYYFVKIFIFLSYLLISLIFSFSTLLLSGSILQYLNKDFSFFDYNVIGIFSAYFIRAFFYISSIAMLHFSLFLWKNSLIMNIFLALFMLSIGVIVSFSKDFYPFLYSSPFRDAFNFYEFGDKVLLNHTIFDILYLILFTFIGLILFKKVKV